MTPIKIIVAQLGTGVIAQAQVEGAGGSSAEVHSLWDFLVKGGPVIIPILVCSLVALTIFVERLVSLRRRAINPPGFLDGLKAILKDGLYDREEALSYCTQNASPIANIVQVGVRHLHEPIERLEMKIEEAGKRQIAKLRKNIRGLTVIAAITPLLGLLGTIFGMINAFQTVATSGEALGKTELLAEGIYEAMITTAAGLSVAIPVIIAYHFIAARIDLRVAELDRMTVEFIEHFGRDHASDVNGGRLSVSDTTVGEDAAVA